METQIVEITAALINNEYRKARTSMVDSVNHILTCGRLLTEKKAELGHGNFESWVDANCDFGPRTARKMMAAGKRTLKSDLTEEDAAQISRDTWGNSVTRGTQGTGENEWYTPAEHLNAVRDVLGFIDLDPASSHVAQQTVQANSYLTIDDNALERQWISDAVFLNPPYAQPHIYNFVEKLVSELVSGNVTEAILLTHNYTDTLWFHRAEEVAAAICFTRGRIKFIDSEGVEAAPTQGQAFFYFGENVKVFESRFKEFGFVR